MGDADFRHRRPARPDLPVRDGLSGDRGDRLLHNRESSARGADGDLRDLRDWASAVSNGTKAQGTTGLVVHPTAVIVNPTPERKRGRMTRLAWAFGAGLEELLREVRQVLFSPWIFVLIVVALTIVGVQTFR